MFQNKKLYTNFFPYWNNSTYKEVTAWIYEWFFPKWLRGKAYPGKQEQCNAVNFCICFSNKIPFSDEILLKTQYWDGSICQGIGSPGFRTAQNIIQMPALWPLWLLAKMASYMWISISSPFRGIIWSNSKDNYKDSMTLAIKHITQCMAHDNYFRKKKKRCSELNGGWET